MFENFLNIEKKGKVNTQWKAISDLSKKYDLQYQLRPKEKYGINHISYFGLIKTNNEKSPLLIVLIDLEKGDLFLNSDDFSKINEENVSLNNLLGALCKTIEYQCLFVFELKNHGKFKLCYHRYETNKNDAKHGFAKQDARTNYSHVNISLTPWIHTDFQSRRIKNAISQINDLFEESSKKTSDELFSTLQNIIKDVSSDNIIASLSGEIIQEGNPYYLSSKRLFAGLDNNNPPNANKNTLVETYLKYFGISEEEILSSCDVIHCYDARNHDYPKIDVEDFWCALKKNPKTNKILEEKKIEDLSDCFNENISEQTIDSDSNNITSQCIGTENSEINKRKKTKKSKIELEKDYEERMKHFHFGMNNDEFSVKASAPWYSSEFLQGRNTSLNKEIPVDTTYYEAVDLCNRRSKIDGLKPCYELNNKRFDEYGERIYDVKRIQGNGYRLISKNEFMNDYRFFDKKNIWLDTIENYVVYKIRSNFDELELRKIKCQPTNRCGYVVMICERDISEQLDNENKNYSEKTFENIDCKGKETEAESKNLVPFVKKVDKLDSIEDYENFANYFLKKYEDFTDAVQQLTKNELLKIIEVFDKISQGIPFNGKMQTVEHNKTLRELLNNPKYPDNVWDYANGDKSINI